MIDIIELNDGKSEKNFDKIDAILNRSQLDYKNIQQVVDDILLDVRKNGDEALFSYTEKFDKILVDENSVIVSDAEIKKAYADISDDLLDVIKKAVVRIKDFHQKQKINSWLEPDYNGETMGQLIRPIENVGVYVPGGKASYPSSVIMNVIPAKVAGVKNIYMVTPSSKDGINCATIVAAVEAGVSKIFKIGGAQAVAALAYGTETVPKVDKICGPGNIYVAVAKKTVFGHVNIDSVAGPSEILVIADKTANPSYVAADMLSQAEHDELASSILITDDLNLANEVNKQLVIQTNKLSRKEIIETSLKDFGAIIVVDDLKKACEISNSIAPEHLEICTNSPFSMLNDIKNAGAIFLGHYTPEPLGDYMAGPNHVLPTSGTAKFFSPLTVDDFIKKSSVISFTKEALFNLGDDVIKFANAESLTAHANAIKIRLDNENE